MPATYRPIPFVTSFAIPILMLLGTTLVALALVSWQMSARLDEQSMTADAKHVDASMTSELNDFNTKTQDHATWNDMVDHVVRDVDRRWIARALGPELNRVSGLSTNAVVRDDGRAVFVADASRMVGGDGSALAGDGYATMMTELLAQKDGEERAVGYIAQVRGMVTLVSGMRIRPEDKVIRPELARRYFIVTKRIDPAYVATISKHHYINGLQLAAPGAATPPGMGSVPVRDWSGRVVGLAHWRAELPGSDILRRYAPGLGLVVLFALGMAAWVLMRAHGAVRQLNDNWRLASAMARRDELTGLHNRRALSEGFDSRRAQALFIIDLNHFKNANDTHGHAAGDAILRHVASRLNGVVPRGDDIYRLGGDEFAVLSASSHDDATAARLAEAMATSIAAPMLYNALELHVTASIGIAMVQRGETLDGLLHRADLAMYMTKSTARVAPQVAAERDTDTAKQRRTG